MTRTKRQVAEVPAHLLSYFGSLASRLASGPGPGGSVTAVSKKVVFKMTVSLASVWDRTINGKPRVGATARRQRRISFEDIEKFSDITGDFNPLHYDQKLAEASVFGRLIVQGGVTSGILNALVAQDLPGPGSVFLNVEWRFSKAVGVDEQIIGEVEVLSVRNDKPICELATRVFNSAGDECLQGKAVVYVTPFRNA